MVRSLMILSLLVTVARADPADDAHALGEKFKVAVASGDVDAVLACYVDDARVVYPGQGSEARGKAALRTLLEKELPGMRNFPMTQKSSDAIALDASHILNVGRWEATVPDPDGRPTTAVVRTTELLVKENGVWRYLVDHASIGAPPPSATRGHRRRRR